MSKWNIYHKDGSKLTDVNEEDVTVHGLEYSDSWMGECYLTINFNDNAPINFEIGDYIVYRGERFELNYDPGKLKDANKDTYGEAFKYDSVKFNALQDELSRAEFLDVVLGEYKVDVDGTKTPLHYTSLPKFSFYVSTLDDLLDRIQANLDEQIGKGLWKIFSRSKDRSAKRGVTEDEWNEAYGEGTDDNTIDSKSISFDSKTCWEALALVNSEWDVNFIVRGRNIYVGTAGVPTANIFKYGLGNGLYEVDQNADADQSVITRLRAYGSDKNLPPHYYADLGLKYRCNITNSDKTLDKELHYVNLLLDLDYVESYFKTKNMYLDGREGYGYVLRVTFDFKTVVTGFVQKDSDSDKCRFCSNLRGDEDKFSCTADEPSEENLETFTDQVKAGNTVLYMVNGINEDYIPYANKEYADNLPNNMAINRLMLPGFPRQSLKEFWDGLSDTEKKYCNPSGKEHIFSTDKNRPYIDSLNIEKIGLRPASQYFDTDDKKNGIVEIYPTIEEMEIGGARVDEINEGVKPDDDGRFNDGQTVPNVDIYLSPLIDFDINDLKDDDFAISMKDGMCGGRNFTVAASNKIDGRWRLTIERVKDDSLDLYFPYKDFPIRKGDHFVLTGIKLPDSYVRAASLKLLKYAIAFLDKNDYTRYVYQPKVDEIFMARQHDAAMSDQTGTIKSLHDTLKAGDIMQLEDTDLGIKGKITIDQLVIKEEDGKIPTYEVTLREDKEVGTIQKIQQQISSLESGNGGSGGGATVAQVKNQVAAEGRKHFLSKLFDDIANGAITFMKRAFFKMGFDLGDSKHYIDGNGDARLGNVVMDDVTTTGNTQLGGNGTETKFGDYKADSTGAAVKVKQDGTSIAEFDYITIRRAADFRSVTIHELRYIGGELAITPAAMQVSKVERLDKDGNVLADDDTTEPNKFKCYFDTTDTKGEKKAYNEFMVGDQARCQQFGIAEGTHEFVKTKYYWRLVVEVGEDYIVLSNVDKDPLTTSEPAVNDNIVQLGYRYADQANRQAAIILSATSNDAPSQKYYQGINDYSLDHVVKDEGYDAALGVFHCNVYGDSYTGDKDGHGYFKYDSKTKKATFKGTMVFNSDSTLPDGSSFDTIAKKDDLENLNIKSGNLLRNTSFCGDYESIDIADDTEISDDKEVYSEKLKYWTMDGVSVVETEDSTSGKAVVIDGTLSQELAQPLLDGNDYVLSFKGKGTTLHVGIGGETHDVEMASSMERYELHVSCKDASDKVFSMAGSGCTICEVMLSYGTIAPAWSPAYSDNDKSMAEFRNFKFLTDAMTEGSTTIDGGLVMSQMFKVGNFRNRKMVEETGGMSGYYNDGNSPFLWGGGSMEQAIYTIQKYKDDPTFQPTEDELKSMANFVVTHGGRAILNDIVLRGIIYAEGGVMKSVKSPNGNFEIDDSGNVRISGTLDGVTGSFKSLDCIGITGYEPMRDDNGNVMKDEDGNVINDTSKPIYRTVGQINFDKNGFMRLYSSQRLQLSSNYTDAYGSMLVTGTLNVHGAFGSRAMIDAAIDDEDDEKGFTHTYLYYHSAKSVSGGNSYDCKVELNAYQAKKGDTTYSVIAVPANPTDDDGNVIEIGLFIVKSKMTFRIAFYDETAISGMYPSGLIKGRHFYVYETLDGNRYLWTQIGFEKLEYRKMYSVIGVGNILGKESGITMTDFDAAIYNMDLGQGIVLGAVN